MRAPDDNGGCPQRQLDSEAQLEERLIEKLGLALDETSRHNKENRKRGRSTYKERLDPPAQQTRPGARHLRT
jgi:hypothetical protein